jgi:hypothetical protein
MSLTTTIADINNEAPDFLKILEDGASIFAAIASKNIPVLVTALPTYETDVVKVFNDIKNIGVSQAIAAGTVAPTNGQGS